MVRIEEVTDDEPATVRVDGRVTASSSSSSSRQNGFQAPPVQFGSPNGDRIYNCPVFTDTFIMAGPGTSGMGGGSHVIAFTTQDGRGVHMVGIPAMPPEIIAKPRLPVVQSLSVSLEMLYTGGIVSCCLKSQATDALGPTEPQRTKNFQVEILPGYKDGTQIKFDSCFPDDELYPGEPKVDVTFLIQEQKHNVFKRKNAHLHADIKLSKEQLMSESFELPLQLLNGQIEYVRGSRGVCAHGATRTLPGLGMPIRRGGQSTSEYGDLIIRFSWPMSLRVGPKACCIVS